MESRVGIMNLSAKNGCQSDLSSTKVQRQVEIETLSDSWHIGTGKSRDKKSMAVGCDTVSITALNRKGR